MSQKTKVRVITKSGVEHICTVEGPLRDIQVLVKKAVLSLDLSMREIRDATIA